MNDLPQSSPPGRIEAGVLVPLRRASRAIRTACLRTAAVGLLAAAVIAGSVAALAWPITAPGAVVLGLFGAALAVPGLVVLMLGHAVAGLGRLPDSLFEQASGVGRPPLSLQGGPVRSVWRVGRYLMDARGRLWAMRDELVAAGLVVRMAHPAVLLSVLGAVVAISAMIPAAVLLLLLALVF